jgi:hypothetical protein
MWLIFSLFVTLIISINASEKQLYEQKLSTVDAELIAFANSSLSKHFRHEKDIRPTHILRIKTAVTIPFLSINFLFNIKTFF